MKLSKLIPAFIAIFVLAACQKNPFTGKKSLALVSNSKLLPMSFQQYDNFLDENDVVRSTDNAEMVKTVGQNIAHAAEKYLNAHGKQGYLKDYKWEYHLVNSDEVNAWCMPGGKIVVYSGILPITQNETGLAVVMGHEVSHALANHGQQKMSQDQLTQLGAALGSAAFNSTQSQKIFNAAYGAGTKYGLSLPYSRKFERQADEVGIKLMAIAGYDPAAAPKLWKRMQEHSGGKEPAEFLSTHPSSQSRIDNLKSLVDDARETAKKYGVTSFK